MRDHLIPEAVLFVVGCKIADFGKMRSTPIPNDCDIINTKGAYVGPGLVDHKMNVSTVILNGEVL